MTRLKLFYPLYPWTITQAFGWNIIDYSEFGLKGHNGIDAHRGCRNGHCYETDGANVRAAHDGVVTYAGYENNEGAGVVVRTTEQFLDKDNNPQYWKTIYWHLKPDIPIKVGTTVRIGDIIGYADNTGFSTGVHLHFGLKPVAAGENDWVWWNVEQNNGYLGSVDPAPYFVSMSAYEAMGAFQTLRQVLSTLPKSIQTLLKAILNL